MLALPQGVQCFAIDASTAVTHSGRMRGDGLVPVHSALGRHADSERMLGFDEGHQWIALGTTHFGLLSSLEVYAKLRAWLNAG